MELLGIQLTEQEFDFLMCEQANGKELKVVDGKVIAVDRVITEEEKAQARINELKLWFDTDYARQEQKYRRLIALGKTDDDGVSADIKLNDLYLLAENNRTKIQELEKLI